MKTVVNKFEALVDNANGRVVAPILLYILGVPGFLCVLLWLFFFRGK
jgi:hypothetical protein